MKIIEFIKKNKRKGQSVYIAKVHITDNDIKMFEDLAYCYVNVEANEEDPSKRKFVDFQPKYNKWLKRQFLEVQKFWLKYD